MARHQMWFCIGAALCLLAWGPLACAQVRVAGRVTNQNEVPVDGAKITVADIPFTRNWEAVSDPTGSFLLQLPAAGDYSLKVDREGFFVASELRVSVPADATEATPFEVHISLTSIHEIRSTVEVKGEPGLADMDRVTPQTTLSSRSLYDIPFPNPNSLRSGLRLVPGVVQDNAGGIHLYGGSEDQAQYSFEGFQLNAPLTGNFDARMSLESVESVDVQSSPSDAGMGRGEAGTMLLRARTGTDEFKFSGTEYFPGIDLAKGFQLESWTPRGYFSGPWRKKRAWFFNTSEFQFVRATVKQLPSDQNTSTSWRVNDLLHNQFNLSDKNILFVGLLFDFVYTPYSGLAPLDPRPTTVKAETNQWFGYVKDQRFFSGSSMIEVGFAASADHSTAIPHGDLPYLITPDGREGNYYSDARRDAQRLQGIVNYYFPSFHFLGEHRLKTGGDIVHLDYQQNITRNTIDYLNSAGAIIRAINFTGSGQLTRGNDEAASYIQDSWRVRQWLLVEAGLRADEDRLLNRLNWSPRAGFAVFPPGSGKVQFSGSFARIVDPTNLLLFTRPLDQSSISNYYDALGNLIYGPVVSVYTPGTNLVSPHADVWTLGVQRVFRQQLLAKLQLLRRRFSDGFDYTNNLPAVEQLPAILAGAPNPGAVIADYVLDNQRQDHYDSAEVSFGQPLKGRFQWMVSYTRSSAESNAVIQRSVDQPLSVTANTGPLPWDAPNRLLSWGYLPIWKKDWSLAYMLDWHTGLPFSIQDPYGELVGTVDAMRFPEFFELNAFIERFLSVRGHLLALRGGLNNLTGHFNPAIVDNVAGGATYLREYNGQPRSLNFQVRLLDHR
ncbi:MAG TPA: carboxypeptidase regulatory-like domain-containing protein [Bryobacteraceae bacterium]